MVLCPGPGVTLLRDRFECLCVPGAVLGILHVITLFEPHSHPMKSVP